MTYLRCPDCRLTAHATAYFIQGDRCPRCLTTMEPAERFREAPAKRAGAATAQAAIVAEQDARALRSSPRAG